MKLIAVVLLVAFSAVAQCSSIGLVGPSAHGIVLQGPSSKTSLVGPDGSHIVGVQAGGTVVAPGYPGGVVAAAVVPGVVAHAAPLIAGVGVGILAPGAGHEGQYVHDYTELLYDDGSYRGDYHH